jgi:hypothetical protein
VKTTQGKGLTSAGQPYIGAMGRRITAPDPKAPSDIQNAWLEGFQAGAKAGQPLLDAAILMRKINHGSTRKDVDAACDALDVAIRDQMKG